MYILFMVLTGLAVVALVAVLAYFLIKIIALLESIGGTPTSYLAKLRLGLRAIEQETGHLPPQVTRLNGALGTVADGLGVVDEHLRGTIEAVGRQDVPK